MKISLLVIRCKDIEASKHFYQLLGLSFTKEKHGSGPVHYSCECDGFVFELYPNKAGSPLDNNRLGFNVSDLANVIKNIDVVDKYQSSGKTTCIAIDPDGRKVEISE